MPIDYDRVAELYDRYAAADYDHAFFRAEVAGIRGPILELTSGTGRLSIPLLAAGADLTCVDCSPGMLTVLERKLAALGLTAAVHRQDICALDLPTRFALAILPFQSFMELVGEESQRQALAAIFRHLLPGGRFLCTLHNPPVRRRAVDGTLRLVGRFATPEGSLVVSGFETGGNPVVARLQQLELYDHDGRLTSKLLQPMEFELIDAATFERLATAAGFAITQVWGEYDRSPFEPATSPVMIWDLRRP